MIFTQNIIPGITNNYVPQAVCYLPRKEGSNLRIALMGLYKTGTFYGKCPSALLAIDLETNKVLHQFELFLLEEQAFTARIGGLCVCQNSIWCSQEYKRDAETGVVVRFPLDDVMNIVYGAVDDTLAAPTMNRLIAKDSFYPDSKASFLYYERAYDNDVNNGGILWVGDFCRTQENTSSENSDSKNYRVPVHHQNGCAVGYELDPKSGLPKTTKTFEVVGKKVLQADQILIIGQNVHGMTIFGDALCLSLSYGANDSTLSFHRLPSETTYIKYSDNVKLEARDIDSETGILSISMPAGSTALAWDWDNKHLLLGFESGSNLYCDKWRSRGAHIEDRLLELNIPKILNQSKS